MVVCTPVLEEGSDSPHDAQVPAVVPAPSRSSAAPVPRAAWPAHEGNEDEVFTRGEDVPPGCTIRLHKPLSASPLWVGVLPPGVRHENRHTRSRSFAHSAYIAPGTAQASSATARAEVLAWLQDWHRQQRR